MSPLAHERDSSLAVDWRAQEQDSSGDKEAVHFLHAGATNSWYKSKFAARFALFRTVNPHLGHSPVG